MSQFGASGNRPAVSVVMASRNCLSGLPATVAGIEAQGTPDLEVIVVDDGSVDGTAEWLRAKQRAAPWLILLHGRGEGPNVARNRAIAAAKAPLVAFLDVADAWLPGKLAAQLAFHAADPEVGFSFTDCRLVNSKGHSQGTWFDGWPAFHRASIRTAAPGADYRRLDRPAARLLAEDVVPTSTVVARRDLVRQVTGFDGSLRSAMDRDLWLRLARVAPVGFTPACGTCRPVEPASAARSGARLRIACMRQVLAAHAPAIVVSTGGAAAVRRARAQILAAEANLARSEGRHRSAARARLGALWRTPCARLAGGLAADLMRAVASGTVRAAVSARACLVAGRPAVK